MQASELSDAVEFDCPFTVTESGDVIPADNVYAPDVSHDDELDITIDGQDWRGHPTWSPLVGYTGQWSYNGAVMHASEQLAGRIARDILDDPGTYVVTVVNVLPDDDDPDPEPAGWCVLKLRD